MIHLGYIIMYETQIVREYFQRPLTRIYKFPSANSHEKPSMYIFYGQRGFKDKKTVKDSMRVVYVWRVDKA